MKRMQITNNDSIKIWIDEARNKKYNPENQKLLLQKAYLYIKKNKTDSPLELSSIAYEFYKLKDTISFLKVNKDALKLSQERINKYAIGDVHWNYATFFLRKEVFDKAYFHFNKAYKAFISNDNKNEASKILYGMARIKGKFRDYTGSEIMNIEAIKLFKQLNNYEYLYTAYNHLALLQNDIHEYDRAIKYFNKSLEYFAKIKDKKKNYTGTYNNIANAFLNKGNYKKALKFYNKDLSKDTDKFHLAIVLDNRAHCKLLMQDTLGIREDFFKALKIRDSLNDKTGILMSKIRISDYFLYVKDTSNAIHYSSEANLLAKELKNGRDYLASLKQLANLDYKNSKKYLDRYIEFNDSLISVERRAQNKFTRIEFETDEHIEDNKRLTAQRIWIFAASIGLLLILSLLYFVRVQKMQNEKLQLETAQQKANEEVYVLTLEQQAKLEEERIKERNRISAELHDGILGKLFGTRVNLGFLGMQMQPNTQEQHQVFLDELQTIEKEIREVSHRLSENFDDATINFTTIITQLLKDKSTIGKFEYTFTHNPYISWKSVSEIIKANVYRIIQEALQNIIKHANAKNVILDFSLENQKLTIKIQDDGVGFDTKKGKKGIGIKNIKTRIEKLSGSVDFVSEVNKGTTLKIYIPYFPKDAADKV